MKRIAYIGLVVLGLVVVSCGKQTIRPNASSDQEIPQWRGVSSAETDGQDPTTTGEGTITDPNNDEDGNRRRKQ